MYLLNIHFRIVTDCNAFVQTMSKKNICFRVARWALQLEEFDYEVVHRAGTAMRHVDALSRSPIGCLIIDQIRDAMIAQIKQAQIKDSELQQIVKLTKADSKEFTVSNGILYKREHGNLLLAVPKRMQREVIIQAHQHGHIGW